MAAPPVLPRARLSALAMLLSCVSQGSSALNFTMHSEPIELRPGQVYNKIQKDPFHAKERYFPKEVVERYASGEKDMLITGFTVDMVRSLPGGGEEQVLLSDHYLHHYILHLGQKSELERLATAMDEDSHLSHMFTGCHGMRGQGLRMYNMREKAAGREGMDSKVVTFGSASGAEYRHNPQFFLPPFGVQLHRPDSWMPVFHVINTREDPRKVSPLLECPCTPQRKFNVKKGLIDGKKPDPPFGCSEEYYNATHDLSCHISTYVGGWRCCENGVFLIDTDKWCRTPRCLEKPKDKVVMKFTFYYQDVDKFSRDIEPSACCDVTGNDEGFGNVEHDVPPCKKGTPPHECLFVAESVQQVGYYGPEENSTGADLVDLVLAAPHLHWAGKSIELIDHLTNRTLCEVYHTPDERGGVMYGHGTKAGDEEGYLVGLKPCVWGDGQAPRFRRDHKLRTRTVYNASTYHTGVMSLWLASVSAVEKPALLV